MGKIIQNRDEVSPTVSTSNSYDTKKGKLCVANLCKENIIQFTDVAKLG